MKWSAGLVFCISVFLNSSSAHAENCNADLLKVDNFIREYQVEAINSKSQATENTYQKIKKLLFQEIGESDPCFEESVRRYATFSFSLYEPSVNAHFVDKKRRHSETVTRADNTFQTLLSQLIEKGKIVFLTEKRREALGDIWKNTDPDTNEYSALGGYDCATTKIYVDAYLRPFDLTMTLYHEMDHLFRDRALQALPADYSGDWSLYNFADESQAIATSAMIYWGLLNDYRVVEISILGPGMEIDHYVRLYHLKNDFSLFSEEGPVKHFGEEHVSFAPRIANSLLYLPLSDAKATTERSEYFSTIWNAYFPNEAEPALSSDKIAELPTLRSLMWNEGSVTGAMLPTTNVGKQPVPDESFRLVSGEAAVNHLIDELTQNPAPSLSCQAYLTSLNAGNVDRYLGTKFSKRSSIRPCLNLRRKL